MANLRTSGVFNLGALGGDGAASGDAHWSDVTLLLDGSSKTTDIAGLATISASTGISVTTASPDAYGVTGGAVLESADDDQGITASGTNLFTLNADFTLEAWVKIDTEASNNTLFRVGSITYASLIGHNPSSGSWSLYLPNATDNGWSTNNATLFTGLTAGSGWHHIALTKSGTTFRGFVDGVQTSADIVNATTFPLGNGQLKIGLGDGNPGSGYGIDGQWQDVRYTNGVARYTSNFTPPSASLPQGAAVAATTRPMRRWGGMTGRSLVASGNVPTTGVLSLPELLQARYGVASAVLADILMVGGGGGGGGADDKSGGGGGGGAGAMFYTSSPINVLGKTFTITIGGGGAGHPGNHAGGAQAGTSGNATTLQIGSGTTITAPGGGGGARTGGSGGGAHRNILAPSSTANSTNYSGWNQFGNAGGRGSTLTASNGNTIIDVTGGGGGGAGSAGNAAGQSSPAGLGGSSRAWPVDNVQYAGGGGGGRDIDNASSYTISGGGAGAGNGGNGTGTAGNGQDASIAGRGSGGGGSATDSGAGPTGGTGASAGDGSRGQVAIFIPQTNFTAYSTSGLSVSVNSNFTRADTGEAGTLLRVNSGTNGTITFN